MFAVLFEVWPRADRWDAYLGHAALLRPELLRVEGFLDNVRYASKRRPGWLLSLSTWRDEKALVRWRTHALHSAIQAKGRTEVFQDYHLRVGEVATDTHPPDGVPLLTQRLDETEDGAARRVSIVETARPGDLPADVSPETIARRLGLPGQAEGLVGWDVFEAILTPGALLLLLSWKETSLVVPTPLGARTRDVRVIRDYGMFRRHEAPRYYPPVARAEGDSGTESPPR